MPVWATQPIGVKVTVGNRSTQEAGAPIAFREEGVGTVDTWTGEPWEGGTIWTQEEDVELLLDADVEPDADGDGYGDLTQDCFLNLALSRELCGRDLEAPTIRPHFTARQAFLGSGVVLIRVESSETGLARAEGRLSVKGREGWTSRLRGAYRPVVAGRQATLPLRVRNRALVAARRASRQGRRILVTARVAVTDAAGNERQATARVHPAR